MSGKDHNYMSGTDASRPRAFRTAFKIPALYTDCGQRLPFADTRQRCGGRLLLRKSHCPRPPRPRGWSLEVGNRDASVENLADENLLGGECGLHDQAPSCATVCDLPTRCPCCLSASIISCSLIAEASVAADRYRRSRWARLKGLPDQRGFTSERLCDLLRHRRLRKAPG